VHLENQPRWKTTPIRALKVLSVAVSEFFNDQCLLRASSLTFYTLMSIVPVFAVIFGIAKGFGLEKVLERELMQQMAGQEQVIERILAFSKNMLENTRGGLIAGVGVLLMLWSAVKVLSQIEAALNAMWDVREKRSWGRRFSDYLAVMFIGPILVLVSGSASVFIRTQFGAIAAKFQIVGWMSPLVFQALRLTPLVLVWALFTLIYKAMPNTRVRFGAAAWGAAIGGLLYQIVQWLYIDFQVGVAKQNAIYGSFAALPLFLAWVQLSWTIVLFGAELCYAFEHAGGYCQASGCPVLAPADKKLLGLRIAREVIHNFAAGGKPMAVQEITHRIAIPGRLVKALLADLVDCGILSEIRRLNSREETYQPAINIDRLTIHRVIDALETAGGRIGMLPEDVKDTRRLRESLDEMSRVAADSSSNRLLKDL
jgi:membrane protein